MSTRFCISLAVLLLCAGHAFPAGRNGKPEREIRAILKAQTEAWSRGDIDGYMNGYARGDATQFVSGDTVTRGWQTVRNRYAKRYDTRQKMGTLNFSDVEVTLLSDNAALVTGRWQLARRDDKPRGRFTVIFRRLREGWRVVHDHTSSATP